MKERKRKLLIELENKYVALAWQEIEERKKAGFAVTPEWLDALERKHQALALQEIAVLSERMQLCASGKMTR